MRPRRRDVIKGMSAFGLLAVAPSKIVYPCEVPPPVPAGPPYLGCPFTATSLGDIKLRNQRVFLPFISPVDGFAKTLTFYGVWADGYGAGTGGTVEITIVDSVSGHPGIKIGSGSIVHKDLRSRLGARGKWSIPGTFSAPVGPLQKGKLYFARFDSINLTDDEHYIGVDILNHSLGYAFGSKFVPSSPLQMFIQSDTGTSFWTHPYRVANCIDVGYDNGQHFSWPYMETWNNSNHWNARVTATQWSRQHLKPLRDMTLTEMVIAASVISGSGGLIVELRDSATILTRVIIPASAFGSTQVFCSPRKLLAPVGVQFGKEYLVVVRAESGTTFRCYPLRCGAKSGGAYAKIVDGWCEWSTNSGASWSGGWYGWNSTARLKTADLPVAFR